VKRPRLHTRARLTAAYAGIFALLATGAAAAFWLVQQSQAMSSVDAILGIDARDAVSNVQEAASGAGPLVLDDAVSGYQANITVLSTAGTVEFSLGQGLSPGDATRVIRDHGRAGAPWTGTVSSGSIDQRLVLVPVSGVPNTFVLVSYPLAQMEHDLGMEAMLLAEVVAALVVLTSALGYGLAGRALRPAGVIAGIARDLSERDLHRRIELSLPADELGELAATFNSMLARLEKAFLAQRNFTADAAHELRAPLTLIRAELECATKDDGRHLDRAGMRALIAETDRLSRLVGELLLMAQADAGGLTPQRTDVDVADLVVERADRWCPLAAAKGVQLLARAPDSGTLRGDVELLGRLIDNLLGNAIRHTPPGGAVELTVRRAGGHWEIDVADTGPGIPPDLRPRLFERFSRPAGARSRLSGGAGLGLAICAAIAAAHGGSIRLLEETTCGAHFSVRVPDT
jgi:signal transduction histidine kinase